MVGIELECLFLKRKGIGPYMAENYLLLDDTKELPIFNATSLVVRFLCFVFIYRLFHGRLLQKVK